MTKVIKKTINKSQRARRVRAVVQGTANRPRLSVTISNLHISAQLIDDESHQTLAAASSIGKKLSGTMTEKAEAIGNDIADKAKTAKITSVVFDRGSKLYHGRVKALADAARKQGLEF